LTGDLVAAERAVAMFIELTTSVNVENLPVFLEST
jgi:hypothetical protein